MPSVPATRPLTAEGRAIISAPQKRRWDAFRHAAAKPGAAPSPHQRPGAQRFIKFHEVLVEPGSPYPGLHAVLPFPIAE